MEHVQYFLIEFAVNYRKKNGEETAPSSMKGYIFGIQRYFSTNWGYKLTLTSGRVFGCTKKGLYCVLDNLFADQQSRGMTPESHNVLSSRDITTLFKSEDLSYKTPT